MPTLFAWAFGLLTLGQTVWIVMEWWANRSRQAHLRGIRDQLRALRDSCEEAERLLKGDLERQLVRSIGHGLRGAEANVGAAMGGRHAPEGKPGR
jgi:hypothetical protein